MEKSELNKKVNGLIKLSEEVKDILATYPATRDDDMLLYNVYIRRHWYAEDTSMTFHEYFMDAFRSVAFREEENIKDYCSIERARRKIQVLNPELRGYTWLKRHANEKAYEEYACIQVNTDGSIFEEKILNDLRNNIANYYMTKLFKKEETK